MKTRKKRTSNHQNHKGQDEETVHPLSSITELDDQPEKVKHFTELDVRWGYDNEHIKDKDKWEMTKTNQELFKPSVIFSSPYSPMTPQTKMDELFQDQKNKQQNIVNRDYDIQMKEQDTENTQCVLRQSRDNDLFPRPDECTPWVARTEHGGLLNSENQPQIEPIKLNGITEWPTPMTTKEVKTFPGFGNFDKEFTQNDQFSMKSLNERNESEQDNKDMVMLPEDLFLNLLNHEFDDERTFENDDGQFDPIKT